MKIKFALLSIATAITILFAPILAFGGPNGTPVPPYAVEDCLINVTGSILLKGPAGVEPDPGGSKPFRSDLCARDFTQIGGRKQTNVPAGGVVQDVAIISKNVKLARFARVVEVIYDGFGGSFFASGKAIGPVSLIDTLDPANDFQPFPPFPLFSVPTTASDVNVPDGFVGLFPGAYGRLTVGASGVVSFLRSGIYIFKSIETKKGCALDVAADDVTILVEQWVHIAEFCRFNADNRRRVTIFVAGADGRYGRLNRNARGVDGPPAAFGFDGDGPFNACLVYVPNGTMNVKGKGGYKNQWIGKHFQHLTRRTITLTHPQELCFDISIGGIPEIELKKQISITGAAPFFDADEVNDPDVPVGPIGSDATYRLIVKNTGTEVLTDVRITDATLGLFDVPVPGGDLGINEERIIDAGDFGFGDLFFLDRCLTAGQFFNIARVDAEGVSSGLPVSADDPAWLRCADESITFKKQISITGNAPFFDADAANAPDVPVGPLGTNATYRLIVKNTGSTALTDVRITDPTLNLFDVLVPGGNLAPNEERIITRSNLNFSNLFFPNRCVAAGQVVNIAQVDAVSTVSGLPVSADDPAWLRCVSQNITLRKQISIDGGGSFFDADTANAPDVPVGPLGTDATYRLIVKNTGPETLVNVRITDATLNLFNVAVPGGPLAPNEERTITTGSVGFSNLFFPDRCTSVGQVFNIAKVDAEGEQSGTAVSDENPAWLTCADESIRIRKQISIDGGQSFFDADAANAPDVPVGPLVTTNATYRLIVTNTGSTTLTNARITDPTLGLNDVLVPGGDLAPGDVRTIDEGTFGFDNLSFPDRCTAVGTVFNIAQVEAVSTVSGLPLSDDDPAWLRCVNPAILLKKQISITGGAPFFDADTSGAPDVPVGAIGADATYRLIVRNIGSEVLTNVRITDATLGLNNVPIPGGDLGINEDRIIDVGAVGFNKLFFANRCTTVGQVFNIARVDAAGKQTAVPVSDDDPAWLRCVSEGITLKKQISITGGAPFFDADAANAPDVPVGPIGTDATYRLIVRNTGATVLTNVRISDPTLGLTDALVPGGDLLPGQERTIDFGSVPFDRLFVQDRCTAAGQVVNTAVVNAVSVTSGLPLSDDDPAWLTCVTQSITLKKQISIDGGGSFFDADAANAPDVPVGPLGTDATYRLIVKNTGTEVLTNVVINDPTLGLVNVSVGDLQPDEERTITRLTSGFSKLFVVDRCVAAGQVVNTARVNAVGKQTSIPVNASDPAWLTCVNEGITLKKQISITGGAPFFDADAANAPDVPAGPIGTDATYRLIVKNTGATVLTDVRISDPTLGLNNVLIPGNLLLQPNEQRTINAGAFGFDRLFFQDRCVAAEQVVNIARVDAVSTVTNLPLSDDDPAWLTCTLQQCTLNVTKTCEVQQPAPPAGKCEGKLKELTMIWNGPGSIQVSGLPNNAPGGQVNVNDEVTFFGPFSSNDVFVSITGAVNGESKFHVSCSDDDMDGDTASNEDQQQVSPVGRDCGKFQGNGKDTSGFINQWLLEGFVDDNNDVLDCTASTGPGASSCEIESFPTSCELGNPTNLTWLYSGGGCGASDNDQESSGDLFCDELSGGIDGTQPVTITDDDNNVFNVEPGEVFTTTRQASKVFMLTNAGGTEENGRHISCSQPLQAGDVYGSLTLVALDGQGVGRNVTYGYTITNTGSTEALITQVNDDVLGNLLGVNTSLAQGETLTLSETQFVTQSVINTVNVVGQSVPGGAACVANQASATVEVVPVTCEVTGDSVLKEVRDDKIKWEVTNTGRLPATIELITLTWPTQIGNLDKVKRDGDDIFKDSLRAPPMTILGPLDWVAPANKRQIKIGTTDTLEFQFDGNYPGNSESDYTITVEFEEGCSVTFP